MWNIFVPYNNQYNLISHNYNTLYNINLNHTYDSHYMTALKPIYKHPYSLLEIFDHN